MIRETGLDHVLQLVFILRRHHHHVRHVPQIGVIERAVVRRPVLCHQPTPIDAEGDRQVLRRHVVDDLVEGALQEGRIDGHHGAHALRRQPAGEGDRMLLRDAHVVQPVRKLLLKRREAGPFAHCGGNRDDPPVLPRQLDQRVHRDRGVAGARRLLGRLTGLPHKSGTGVEPHGVLHGGLVAEPFLRDHVQQRGAPQLEHVFKGGEEMLKIVAVDRPHIAEAQLLEQQSLEDDALGQFLRPVGDLRDRLTDAGDGAQELPGLLLDAGVKLPGEGPVQVGRDGAHVL